MSKLITSAVEHRAGFILVILPERAEEVRNLVKHTGDVVLGVATQCVVSSALIKTTRQSEIILQKEDKMVGANNQYCNNLALK